MITPNSRGQMLQPFAFNSDATNINFTLTHFYDENCGLLSYLMPLHYNELIHARCCHCLVHVCLQAVGAAELLDPKMAISHTRLQVCVLWVDYPELCSVPMGRGEPASISGHFLAVSARHHHRHLLQHLPDRAALPPVRRLDDDFVPTRPQPADEHHLCGRWDLPAPARRVVCRGPERHGQAYRYAVQPHHVPLDRIQAVQ